AFGGSPSCVYRLTLTTGPYITQAMPLSVPRSNPGRVRVLGWNIPDKAELPVQPYGGTRIGRHQEFEEGDDLRVSPESALGLAFAPSFAGAARVRLVPHGTEPRLAATLPCHPLTLTPPTSVTGWVRNPSQTDVFGITLKKGEQVLVTVEAHSLHFPL